MFNITLERFIEMLEAMEDCALPYPCYADSYRGFYDQVAIGLGYPATWAGGSRGGPGIDGSGLSGEPLATTTKELASMLRRMIGARMDGYKGGWNEVRADTLVHFADYGSSDSIRPGPFREGKTSSCFELAKWARILSDGFEAIHDNVEDSRPPDLRRDAARLAHMIDDAKLSDRCYCGGERSCHLCALELQAARVQEALNAE